MREPLTLAVGPGDCWLNRLWPGDHPAAGQARRHGRVAEALALTGSSRASESPWIVTRLRDAVFVMPVPPRARSGMAVAPRRGLPPPRVPAPARPAFSPRPTPTRLASPPTSWRPSAVRSSLLAGADQDGSGDRAGCRGDRASGLYAWDPKRPPERDAAVRDGRRSG